MPRILFVTHGTAGDVLPFLRIGAAAAAAGHDARCISHAPFARSTDLPFAAVDTQASYAAAQRRTPDLLAVRTPGDLRRYYDREGLFAQLHREVAQLVDWHVPGETVLVGRHTSALSVLIAAELLRAPAVWVAVAPIQLMVAPIAAANVRHGLATGIDEVRASFGLPPVADWRAWLGIPRATIGLWPAWFDRAGAKAPPGTELVGFISGDRTAVAAPAFRGRPVLVTGGTGQLLHPTFYRAALDAVSTLDHPAVVVAPERSLLPPVLPSTVEWHRSLSFPSVLPHMAAVLHHGGIGTAVRAIRTGTPQLILAHGADRPDNAARLATHGLARWLSGDRWHPDEVAAELSETLSDRDYAARAAAMLSEPEDMAPARALQCVIAALSAPAQQPGPDRRALLLRRLALEKRSGSKS